MDTAKTKGRCPFCGKDKKEVFRLVKAGPFLWACEDCIKEKHPTKHGGFRVIGFKCFFCSMVIPTRIPGALSETRKQIDPCPRCGATQLVKFSISDNGSVNVKVLTANPQ
jgi:rubrerythrin